MLGNFLQQRDKRSVYDLYTASKGWFIISGSREDSAGGLNTYVTCWYQTLPTAPFPKLCERNYLGTPGRLTILTGSMSYSSNT